ncbi:MAG TPA: hypothetical protein VHK63_02755 [Candidatus Limnocylindria bacterium]|nr:hypothetical protein [Candidatus Limnocylindria bacterium]
MLKHPFAVGTRFRPLRRAEPATTVVSPAAPSADSVRALASAPTPTALEVRPADPAIGDALLDPVVAGVMAEVRSDPDGLGLLLHGSRRFGRGGPTSSYDFIVIVHDQAHEERARRGTLVEHRFSSDAPPVEIAHESIGQLRRMASTGDAPPPLGSAAVLLDKDGELEALVEAIAAGGAVNPDRVAKEYDAYLHGFVHSLKSASRGDDLGMRAHAADSGLHLVRALFALEGKPAPYLDQLSARLAELEAAQAWRPGVLQAALLRLFYAPEPPFQQMLERRVSRLMEARGVRHEWRVDLDRLRHVPYDEL